MRSSTSMRSPTAARLYRIHGLVVESDVPLDAPFVDPGERPAPDPLGAGPEESRYRVVLGEPRDPLVNPRTGRLLAEDTEMGYWAIASPRDPSQWILRYSDVCEVTVERLRRSITVHPRPGADLDLIGILLGGTVLAHALAMEDRLVLHASAVEVDGRGLAILGAAGSGKSTLASLLCARGAYLISDDTLRVEVSRGRVFCFPGGLGIRLRPGVAGLANEVPEADVRITADGRTAVFPRQVADGPTRLEAAIAVSIVRGRKHLKLERRKGMDALVDLLRYPRLTNWRTGEPIGRLFGLTAEVSGLLAVYRASVPWGPPFRGGLAEDLLTAIGMAIPGGSNRAHSGETQGEEKAGG